MGTIEEAYREGYAAGHEDGFGLQGPPLDRQTREDRQWEGSTARETSDRAMAALEAALRSGAVADGEPG